MENPAIGVRVPVWVKESIDQLVEKNYFGITKGKKFSKTLSMVIQVGLKNISGGGGITQEERQQLIDVVNRQKKVIDDLEKKISDAAKEHRKLAREYARIWKGL